MRRLVPLACFLLATPAAAQFVGKPVYEPVAPPSLFIGDSALPPPPVRREMRDVRQDVERAREAGHLSHRQARRLFRETRRIDALAHRYGRDGLSTAERKELQSRTLALRDAVIRPAATRPARTR